MKIKALVIRIFKQTIHDKRTLALMMVAPLIILSLIYFLFNSDDDVVLNVGVYNTSSEFNDGLKDADLNVLNYSNDDNIKDKIVDDELSAFIYTDGDELNITYENSSPQDTQKIGAIVKSVSIKNNLSNISSVISAKMPNLKSNISSGVSIVDSYVYGDSDTSYFDTINPMLIGFFVFFFVFLVAGISLLKERTSGTLDKLLSTPIKRSEILIGYLLGYGVFAVIQTIIVVLFAIYVLDMHIVGSVYLVLLSNVVIAFVALSLGIFFSTFANSEFQMMQFIPIVIVPQIFFSGLIPVESMSKWLQGVAHIIPLYYGADALNGVIIKGYDFSMIQNDIYSLLAFVLVLYVLNVFGLKKYRKI